MLLGALRVIIEPVELNFDWAAKCDHSLAINSNIILFLDIYARTIVPEWKFEGRINGFGGHWKYEYADLQPRIHCRYKKQKSLENLLSE